MARGRVISPETVVYIVHWPADRIVKVGTTILPKRVRKFEIRGAQVLRLIYDGSVLVEREFHRYLSEVGEPAFATWRDAIDHLGAGGGGFTECYRVPANNYEGVLRHLREAG